MDISDQATMREEQERERALLHRKPQLVLTGFCHWCSEPTTRLFCQPECAEDYEKAKIFKLK